MVGAYLQYWRVNFLTMLEYRANFIMWFGSPSSITASRSARCT